MRRLLFTALVALAIVESAQAQSVERPEERTTAGWVFTPAFLLGGQWDSNVTVQSAGNPHFKEWGALVNPFADVSFNDRQTHMTAGYSGTLEAYRRFGELQRFDQRTKFTIEHEISRRLTIGSSLSYADVPSTDRLEILTGQLAFQDIGSRLLDTAAQLEIKTSARNRVVAEYKFRDVTFDAKPQLETDSPILNGGYSHEPSVTLLQDLTSRLTVGAGWKYSRSRVETGVQVFEVHSGTGAVAYRLARNTTLSAGLGASYLREEHGTVAKWGPTFYGVVEQRAGRTDVSVRYERAFLPTYIVGGLTADQSVQATARTPLGRTRSYVEGSLAYGRTRPVEELGLGFQLDSVFTRVAFGYRVARWLRTEACYSGMHQTSSLLLDVDRTRVGVQFITSKPMRIQ
jgi:hypothetical protein